MSTQVQRRKGTTVQHSTFTGASAELTVDTTKNTVVVHDGATAGGIPLAKETGSAISATSLSLPNSTTNGVAFVNSSKVVVAGSTFTFDGNNLSVNNITVGKGPGTGSFNTVVGQLALGANVSSSTNTAIGYNAMKTITTGSGNTAVGTVSLALALDTGNNTAIGWGALFPSTGTQNTALGFNAGGDMTLGSKNVIIGSFSGNDYLYGTGLDIRTLNNYIVLSDGDARVRAYWNGANPTFPGALTLSDGTANGVAYLNGSKVLTSGTALTFDGTNLFLGTGYMSFGNNGYIRADSANNKLTFQGGSSGYLWKDSSNSGDWMALTSTGLGIGTSSPTNPLTVSKTGVDAGLGIFNIARIRDGSGNKGVSIGYLAGSNTAVFTSESTGAASSFGWEIYSGSAWSQAMTLDASGNLGLGVTPTGYAKLQFSAGQDIVIGQDPATDHVIANVGSIGIGVSDGSGAGVFSGVFVNNTFDGTFSSQDIRFKTSKGGVSVATERMRLDTSGNLLVGTTAASGVISNNAQIVGGIINTLSGTNSITTSATTVATLPSRNGATYLFSCQNIGDSGTPASYGATSIISQQTTALAATAIQTGSFTVISVSGLDIQITSTLATKNYKWSLVRIM